MIISVAIYLIMGAVTVYLVDKMLGMIGPPTENLVTNGQRMITAIFWPIILTFLIINFIWGWISGMNNRK
jgi:membrane associated rhomboid family serine protease